MRTEEFTATLPRSPLNQHIAQVHAILVHTGVHRDPNAFAIAEHSLREMARFTSVPDYVRDGIRREVLDEFKTALAQITATDVQHA